MPAPEGAALTQIMPVGRGPALGGPLPRNGQTPAHRIRTGVLSLSELPLIISGRNARRVAATVTHAVARTVTAPAVAISWTHAVAAAHALTKGAAPAITQTVAIANARAHAVTVAVAATS
jgi:hypothetical protein